MKPPPGGGGGGPGPLTPGYPPHQAGIHPTQSSMSRGPPGGASISTTPGSISTVDDDKGRGSYKCGRCGVPKKGHICPYQPKVKRSSDDPAPEMKCVSTQVEMDEFMTLRRLNIEIQGFPESYAAEPSDNCGTEVHPPPQPHHAAMTPSSQHGPTPAVNPGMAPTSHLSGPSGLPHPAAMSMQGQPTLSSLSSMPSQPHPSAAIASMSTTAHQPEQINSYPASLKTDITTSTADVNFKEVESPQNEEDETNTDASPAMKKEYRVEEKSESKHDDDNKDDAVESEETDVGNVQKSDDANRKRGAEEEEKERDDDESPAKKQKL